MKKVSLIALALCAIVASSCIKEIFQDNYGKEVKFSANAETSRILTRTAYSGDRTAALVERIDWEDGDLITIVSDQVSAPAGGSADYSLTLTENKNQYSYATAAPATSSGRGLEWGDGSHTFYAMYPAPATTGAQSGIGIATSGGNGVVTAVLPADQSYSSSRTGKTEAYYADMRLAYMTATTTAASGSDVTLSFTPIVTTFYVTVKNTTNATMTLKRVELSSTQALTATYRATITPAGVRTYTFKNGENWDGSPQASSANKNIYADFGSGISLADKDSVTVALFAVPTLISNLTLSVTSTETGTVSRFIQYNGSPVSFTGGNKHNLNNLGVPPVSYTLTVDKSLLSYDYTGVAGSPQDFTVTAKKTIGSNDYTTPWKTQIKSGSTWVDLDGNCPAWLANFPLNSTGVTTLTRTYRENVTAQPVTSHEDRLKAGKVYTAAGAVYDNSTEANALDLSKYNFINHKQETLITSANTYIVSAPGWYKIPMVYGNLIEKGTTVANACKGRTWALGHLDYFKKSTDANIYLGINYPWLQSSFLGHCRIHWEKYTHWNGSSAETTGRQWSSGSDLGVVTNVKLNTSEEYMYFYVDPAMIRPGNVLLATYTDDGGNYGDCCWSWMIWITDQDMTLKTVGSNRVLPVNLGWIDESEGQYYAGRTDTLKFVSTEVSGLETIEMAVTQPEFERTSTSGWQTYYQWGRKDPLSPDVMNVYHDDGAINKSILHPSNIMYDESNFLLANGSEYYDWTSANYNNLWDSQNNSWNAPTDQLPDHKTVYDPSPRGFSVPPDAAWDDLDDNGHRFENGLFFYSDPAHADSIFFPASGYINYNATVVSDGGSGGYYWTIRPGENVQRRASYCLRFKHDGLDNVSILPQSYAATSPFTTMSFRALAYSIRPVLYDISGAGSDFIEGELMQEITFSEHMATNISDLDGTSITVGNVTVTFAKPNGVQHPSYNASTGIVTLPDSAGSLVDSWQTKMTVSTPSGSNIIRVELVFEASDTGSPVISATSSPVNGGGYNDGRGDAGRYGIWEIDSYTGGVFTPNANSVTFKTAATGSNRYLTGMYVYYKL